ncbi:uncharacterized protein LOC133184634 [Saccostrea echinata]|uniref:uncharacterized protein LOC133184634 n=1 Tax=Saccostrea echinata TaxID=191078 RepID=UPI002A827AE2|nr:uncharacterized protein LOC133184634 [Saccostrea echinata]
MPKRRQPANLRQTCTLYIASNFKGIWWKDYLDNFGDTQVLHVLGPFDTLPSGVIEDIINTLEEKGILIGKYFQILLTDRLRHLHLRGSTITNQLVKILALKSQKLESLHLKYANKISNNLLINVVENLPAVKELDLTCTKCNDAMMKIISLNCPQLCRLSISGCPDVTDKGIHFLCSGKTPKLQYVSLVDSDTSDQSVYHLLRAYPGLIEVDLDININGVAQVIEEDILNGRTESKYGIQKLNWQTSVPFTTNTSLIVGHCPYVYDVTCDGVIAADILKNIASFKSMKKLNLVYGIERMGHDLKEFVQFLQIVGNQLTDLSISNTGFMPLSEIGMFCLNLKHLSIFCDEDFTQQDASAVTEHSLHSGSFKKLETVHIFDNLILASEQHVTFLLYQAENLQKLYFENCKGITSSGLQAAYQQHGFKHLKFLGLTNCPVVDDVSVFKLLLETENELTHLSLMRCFNITQAHNDELTACLKKGRNWDIEYDWD